MTKWQLHVSHASWFMSNQKAAFVFINTTGKALLLWNIPVPCLGRVILVYFLYSVLSGCRRLANGPRAAAWNSLSGNCRPSRCGGLIRQSPSQSPGKLPALNVAGKPGSDLEEEKSVAV